jgi:hypothetical protein
LKSQLARVSEFRHIGHRESGYKLFDIASGEIAIEKVPIGKGKVSVDLYRVRGFERTNARPLTSRSREVRSPECKEGIPRRVLWVQISR